MKSLRSIKSNPATFIVCLMLVGLYSVITTTCTGCKTNLEPGGAYAPVTVSTNAATGEVTTNVNAQVLLHRVDLGYRLAKTTFYEVSQWEFDNRTNLWAVSPEIKRTLDRLRVEFVKVDQDFVTAHDACTAAPTPEGGGKLEAILARLEAVVDAATAVLSGK